MVADEPDQAMNRVIFEDHESSARAIKEAIATVEGVTGDTAEPQATTFEVLGDFNAVGLVKALNAAGFSARVE